MLTVTPEQPPNGAELLDEAHKLLTSYCALPSPEAADAIVLWCAATHALPALPFAPRLSVRSATKRSGKSRVLEVVSPLSHRPLATVNATVAAIFRSLGGDHPPTLIFDEVDSIFGSRKVAENNEDLRGLINAGFERGKPALRCSGPLLIPTEFPTFAMAALAGIGTLPDTIEDRSVIIRMRRRKPTEVVKPFRLRRDRPELDELGQRLAAWLQQEHVVEVLANAQPETDLEDRAADVWEGLLMVAGLAGGDWPERARRASKRLTAESAADESETSMPVQLLQDLREAFEFIKSDHVPTEILLKHVRDIDGTPWADMELTAHRLGRMLREFGIKSTRDTTGNKRGYRRADFTDAWERYPAVQASEASESVNTPSDQAKRSDTSSDALTVPRKASEQASERFRRSDPISDASDASDAYPADDCCRDCQRPMPEWLLAERDGQCIDCRRRFA